MTTEQNLIFEADKERAILDLWFKKLPRWCIVLSAMLRAIMVFCIVYDSLQVYKNVSLFLIGMLAFVVPGILELTFILNSLITSKLLQERYFGWFGFFALLTLAGFAYNCYHLLQFAYLAELTNNQSVAVTMLYMNIVALALSEAAGLLLVMDKNTKLWHELKDKVFSSPAPTAQPVTPPNITPVTPHNAVTPVTPHNPVTTEPISVTIGNVQAVLLPDGSAKLGDKVYTKKQITDLRRVYAWKTANEAPSETNRRNAQLFDQLHGLVSGELTEGTYEFKTAKV